MSGFTAVGIFLTSLFFGLVLFTLWLRIALRYYRVSALSPFSQLILSITDPVIRPVNSLFKLKYQPGQKYDWMAFIILILVEFLKIICLSLLAFHTLMPVVYILLYVLADLIIQPCDLLFYAILIRVIMSYAKPGWQHPVADFLRLLTEPLLILGRKIIPDISGFDFSPIVIMIILKVITLFISASLPWRLI
ncbi:YggT family protein [Legionella quateirensis]|uniref:Integral membrane protein YggT, involved in response to extracytoplasmic stress (Osmotic shock) n=1 Tax=Legionella quateirensis TaxID=45072 RepID=A0A378KRS5_9GAMM|nr:YggT family protein [Legionella quateirensis]KTD43725.1 YggT family protein [Legionella quateirensis]STY17285.1 Integral membrane protein YggT, involved in response to extracytoplasmic stress (osmotic shock) [Legionella quateirensis]